LGAGLDHLESCTGAYFLYFDSAVEVFARLSKNLIFFEEIDQTLKVKREKKMKEIDKDKDSQR